MGFLITNGTNSHERDLINTYAVALDTPSGEAPKINEPLWQQHCRESAANPLYILNRLKNPDNRLSFRNSGGLFNGGVCWWHSRLTRIAQYLAIFNPNEKPVTDDQAYAQVKRLRQGRPTTINGFKNLYDFSLVHQAAIQKNLEEWQILNGGFQLGFLDGLTGSTNVPSTELKSIMDETYKIFQNTQKPLYQVLQLPGILAHAWLITDMQPTPTGYNFSVVDSNYSYLQNWDYQNGSTGFYYGSMPFVAYTTTRGVAEEVSLSQRLDETCSQTKSENTIDSSNSWQDLDTELDAKSNFIQL